MSSAARAGLAERQAELLRALWGKGPVPRGFDEDGVRAEGEALLSKRRRFVARMRPALARALGRRFPEQFAAFAAAVSLPAHACADAAAFASWFEGRLGDEETAERIHWHFGLEALLATQKGVALAADAKADLDLMNALLARIIERRGPLALEEPRLKVALILGSVEALGAGLDREQVESLRSELHAELAAAFEEDSPATLLEGALATVRTNQAVERVLERRLRPEQLARYRARAGSDPFGGASLPRLALPGRSTDERAAALVALWSSAFGLGAGSRGARAAIARSYIESLERLGGAPPSGSSPRTAGLALAEAQLSAQKTAEEALSDLPGLPEEERARVRRGCGSILIELPARLIELPASLAR
jgi:hypothetical protein